MCCIVGFLAVACVAVCTESARGDYLGTNLGVDRELQSDGANTVLKLDLNNPVPSAGTITSFQYRVQADVPGFPTYGTLKADSGSTFEAVVLRPLGGDQFQVVFESAPISTLAQAPGPQTFTPAVPIAVLPGDLFGHYGAGIPFDLNNADVAGPYPSGGNENAAGFYFPVPPGVPAGPLPTTAGNFNGTGLFNNDPRTYAIGVDFTPIPEPAAACLLGFAAAAALLRRRASSGARTPGQC
jgi:hypothetical protein